MTACEHDHIRSDRKYTASCRTQDRLGTWSPKRRATAPGLAHGMCSCCRPGVAWPCGLLEVATRVLCRYVDPTNRLYMLSRHFVWLAPLSTLLLFSVVGLFLAIGTKFWPRRVRVVLSPLHLLLGRSAGTHGGKPPDLPGGVGRPGGGSRVALGPAARAACDRVRPLAALDFSRFAGIGIDPGDACRRGRLAQRVAGSKPAVAARWFPQRATGRDGHGAGRSLERLRLRASDHSGTRTTGQAGNSLRQRPRDGTLDLAVARELLQRPLAP